MEVDKGIKLEETETEGLVDNGLKLNTQYEGCTRCLELQENITKPKEKYGCFELGIGNTNSVIELLDGMLGYMETLKQRNDELQTSIQNGKQEEEDAKITELMIENEVLDCEKKRAEKEIEVWKAKCRELEKVVIDLEKRLSAVVMKTSPFSPAENENKANEHKDASGTPTMNTPCKQHSDVEVFNGGSKGELKPSSQKCLKFSTEGSEHKNISPSTPGVGPRFDPIDISDSDDDTPISSSYNKRPPFCKRRRVACIVSSESESESDSDDNIPIGRLCSKKKKEKEQLTDSSDTPPKRRRIVRAADLESSGVKITGRKENLGSPKISDSSGEDEEEEDDCEGESMDGFIVSEIEMFETSNEMSESDDSEKASESSTEYRDIMADLRRERKDKLKWEYEADMLADLAKSPRLCMRAVCALYRQQTSEEKSCKETILRNGRGFSQSHAFRGSELAEFLTDGDQQGDVKKTEVELQEFDSSGIEQCRKLATHYSKQLFEIYKNNEDLFFHPEEEDI